MMRSCVSFLLSSTQLLVFLEKGIVFLQQRKTTAEEKERHTMHKIHTHQQPLATPPSCRKYVTGILYAVFLQRRGLLYQMSYGFLRIIRLKVAAVYEQNVS